MPTRIDLIQRLLTERGRAEHIEIDGAPRHLDATLEQPHRIALRYKLASRLHACTTELALLEGHYLRVRTTRSRGEPKKYEFDLRYVAPRPVRVRRIAWGWLVVSLVSFAAAADALAGTWSEDLPQSFVLAGRVAAACVGFVASLFFLRRTTESLTFRSEHGLATLVEVSGGFGSTLEGKQFFVELIKSIRAAKLERAQPKHEFLCDALREHFRLWQLGVLSEREYEHSKALILAQH